MARFETDEWIDASPTKIFEYIEDPVHLKETIPSCDELTVTQERPNGGWEGEWICHWGPWERVSLTGEGYWRDIEYEPPVRRVVESSGGIYGQINYEMEAISVYELKPADGGTQVRLIDDIEAPGPDLLTERLVKWEFGREQSNLLANLKANVEDR